MKDELFEEPFNGDKHAFEVGSDFGYNECYDHIMKILEGEKWWNG